MQENVWSMVFDPWRHQLTVPEGFTASGQMPDTTGQLQKSLCLWLYVSELFWWLEGNQGYIYSAYTIPLPLCRNLIESVMQLEPSEVVDLCTNIILPEYCKCFDYSISSLLNGDVIQHRYQWDPSSNTYLKSRALLEEKAVFCPRLHSECHTTWCLTDYILYNINLGAKKKLNPVVCAMATCHRRLYIKHADVLLHL